MSPLELPGAMLGGVPASETELVVVTLCAFPAAQNNVRARDRAQMNRFVRVTRMLIMEAKAISWLMLVSAEMLRFSIPA